MSQTANTDLAVVWARLDVARHAVDQARAAFMPSVSLQAGYERQSAPLWDNDGRGGGVARVVATIPIYTGGLAQTQERAALHGHAAAAYQVAGTMAQIRTAVVRSWSQMAAARASITSIRKQQAASKTALDGILVERKLGQRTMSEVVAAQQAALTSDTAYEQRTRAAYVSLCSMPLLMARLDAGAISVVQSIVLSHFAAVLDSNESAVCLVRCIGGEDGPATVRRQSDDSPTIARRVFRSNSTGWQV